MVWYTQAMKEGEQGNFLAEFDSDPAMVANVVRYEREAIAEKARDKRARKQQKLEMRQDIKRKKIMFREIYAKELLSIAERNRKRDIKNALQMRVFRLDTEITDMKVELAGLISQARARIVLMQDLEWQNC